MKKNIKISVLFITLFLVTACGSTRPTELTTIRINGSPNLTHAPIFIADQEGYFAEYGIQLEMVDFNRTGEAIPLVISGDLDVLAGGVTTGVLNTLRGDPNFKVVADRGVFTSDMGCSFLGILVRKDLYDDGIVRGPEDFQGMKVVTSKASPSELLMDHYLSPAGLSIDDIVISDVPKSSYIDAMKNKSVDIIVTLELTLSQVLGEGDSVLLVGIEEVVGDFQSSVIAYGKNLLKNDPDLGARFLAGYLKGVEQYNLGKTDRNLEILSEAIGQEIELLESACWLPMNSDGLVDFNGVVPFMNWSIENGYLEEPITEEEFFEPSILEAAKELLNQ